MRDLIILLSEIPIILHYAAFGGVAGIIGALLAKFFKPSAGIKTTLTVLFPVIIAIQLCKVAYLPWLDKAAFEAAFMKSAGEIPRQIDDITIIESAGIYDDLVNFNYRITEDIADKEEATSIIRAMLGELEECEFMTSLPERYAMGAVYRYDTNLGPIVIHLHPRDCS